MRGSEQRRGVAPAVMQAHVNSGEGPSVTDSDALPLFSCTCTACRAEFQVDGQKMGAESGRFHAIEWPCRRH